MTARVQALSRGHQPFVLHTIVRFLHPLVHGHGPLLLGERARAARHAVATAPPVFTCSAQLCGGTFMELPFPQILVTAREHVRAERC